MIKLLSENPTNHEAYPSTVWINPLSIDVVRVDGAFTQVVLSSGLTYRVVEPVTEVLRKIYQARFHENKLNDFECIGKGLVDDE